MDDCATMCSLLFNSDFYMAFSLLPVSTSHLCWDDSEPNAGIVRKQTNPIIVLFLDEKAQ